MLYKDNTTKLLNLQDFEVEKIEETETEKLIYGQLCRCEQYCPCCGAATGTIHDYRTQRIKDLTILGKRCVIILKKRRYRCNECGKRFYEHNEFVGKYQRMTKRLIGEIIIKLVDVRTYKSVAEEADISTTTVQRIFDTVNYPHISEMPEVLAIDEFKGNASGEKYQCILTDPKNRIVLDILPTRFENDLNSYFKKYENEQRRNVCFFVSDMWKPYFRMADDLFGGATKIVDKYHWIRQVIWAFERVRKKAQQSLDDSMRKYFKRSRSLLIKPFNSLNDADKQAVNIMLSYSADIMDAHCLKEKFFTVLRSSAEQAEAMLSEWIHIAEISSLEDFRYCSRTLKSWFDGIISSFAYSYTNGFTEGCNNKVKVLKRNAYGYRNFSRFRNRILHIFSHQKLSADS